MQSVIKAHNGLSLQKFDFGELLEAAIISISHYMVEKIQGHCHRS